MRPGKQKGVGEEGEGTEKGRKRRGEECEGVKGQRGSL